MTSFYKRLRDLVNYLNEYEQSFIAVNYVDSVIDRVKGKTKLDISLLVDEHTADMIISSIKELYPNQGKCETSIVINEDYYVK